MSAAAQNSLTTCFLHRLNCRKSIKIASFSNPSLVFNQRAAVLWSIRTRWRSGALLSGDPTAKAAHLSLDSLLSIAEVLCIAPPAIYSTGCLVGFLLPSGPKFFQLPPGNGVFVWQLLLLAVALAIGGMIRRRQWRRICTVNSNSSGVDLMARIEKVEDDLRDSALVVRVLSRQLEKLGIRFRVTRKALKEPIAETAALEQNNSEATRALTVQGDNLKKELGEIQKILLAMQEQQQKQLELVLSFAKAGRLLESKRNAVAEQSPIKTKDSITEKKAGTPIEIQTGRRIEA